MLSRIEITVITIIVSFLGSVIFREIPTTLPKSTAAIAAEEAQGKYLLNAKDKCECGKTVD